MSKNKSRSGNRAGSKKTNSKKDKKKSSKVDVISNKKDVDDAKRIKMNTAIDQFEVEENLSCLRIDDSNNLRVPNTGIDEDSVKGATDLTKGATDLTNDVTDSVNDVTDLTNDVTDLTKDATDLTKGATDLTKGVTDSVKGATDLTKGVTDSVNGESPILVKDELNSKIENASDKDKIFAKSNTVIEEDEILSRTKKEEDSTTKENYNNILGCGRRSVRELINFFGNDIQLCKKSSENITENSRISLILENVKVAKASTKNADYYSDVSTVKIKDLIKFWNNGAVNN
ncbi:hypothetical protein P3W45_001387 [Vairimorpha bombi]|jgi:hypothetical protein